MYNPNFYLCRMCVDREPSTLQLLNHKELLHTKERKRLHFRKIYGSVHDKSREVSNNGGQTRNVHL